MSVDTAIRSSTPFAQKTQPAVPPRRAGVQAAGGAAIALLREIQAEKESLMAENAADRQKLAALVKRNEELDQQEQQLRATAAAAAQAIIEARAGKAQALQEKAAAEAKIASGQAKIEAGQAKIAQAQAKIDSGQAKIDSGQARIAQAQADRAEALASVAEGEERLKILIPAKLAQFRKQMDPKIELINKAIRKIDSLPVSNEKTKLLNELKTLKLNADKLNESLESKESEEAMKYKELTQKLHEFQTIHKGLIAKAAAIK